MAQEWNLRVLYSHKLGKPVDASLKDERKLQQFAVAYVKTTRSKESTMTFAFLQAMQPVDHMPLQFAAAPAPSAVGSAWWQPPAQPEPVGVVRHIDNSQAEANSAILAAMTRVHKCL